MMRDKDFYTSEGVVWRIKELRAMKEMILDEEARLITLKEAADHYKGPVDAFGRPWRSQKTKAHVPGIERQSKAVQQAVKTGYHAILPAYQES